MKKKNLLSALLSFKEARNVHTIGRVNQGTTIISFSFLEETQIKLLADSEQWLEPLDICARARRAARWVLQTREATRGRSKWRSDKERRSKSAFLWCGWWGHLGVLIITNVALRGFILLLILSSSLVIRGHYCGVFSQREMRDAE